MGKSKLIDLIANFAREVHERDGRISHADRIVVRGHGELVDELRWEDFGLKIFVGEENRGKKETLV